MLICHPYILFGKVYFQVFCLFSNYIISSLLLSLESSLYIWMQVLSWMCDFLFFKANIFSLAGGCTHTWSGSMRTECVIFNHSVIVCGLSFHPRNILHRATVFNFDE